MASITGEVSDPLTGAVSTVTVLTGLSFICDTLVLTWCVGGCDNLTAAQLLAAGPVCRGVCVP